jgi:NADH-quinone oxidoreductase subunit M
MMVCVGFTRAAMLGLLRIDIVVLPESMRWAAPMLCALGAAGALYGAAVAMGARDLVSVVAFGFVAMSGVAFAGLVSLTPQALLGAIGGIATSGCAAAAALLAVGALRERIGTVDVRQIRGLAIEAPLLACTLGIAALGVGAVPGSASFWATCLVGIGAVVREPAVATAVLVSAVLLAASQTTALIRIVRGRLPEPLRRSESLTSYGGHVPDLRPRELVALAPLLLFIVLFGFCPAPLLGRAATTARDINVLVNPKGPMQIE